MTKAVIKHYRFNGKPEGEEEEVDIDLASFVWYDLYFGLTAAPRESGWEGSAIVTSPDRMTAYWMDCDDVRAELERRTALMEARRQRELSTAHTRQLLKWLDYTRKFGGFFSPCDSKSDYGWSFDEIKAELATREHIPNKKEAKALRQEAARQARGRRRA